MLTAIVVICNNGRKAYSVVVFGQNAEDLLTMNVCEQKFGGLEHRFFYIVYPLNRQTD